MSNPMASKFADSFKRDWQQKACYAWEAYCLNYHSRQISDYTATLMVRDIAMDLRLAIPHIDWRGKGRAWARPTIGRITFTKGGVHWLTPIHEFAHIICAPGVGHGPQFVRNYIELLAKYRPELGTLDQLFASATEHGVAVAQHFKITMISEKVLNNGHDLTDLYDLL